MERLNVRTLLLELTRNCNIECAHCFRGDSQNYYMSLDIIDYIFKNVCRINELLLTGGEPFLAINQLKCIRDNILKDFTNISDLIIVTNGTVLDIDIIDLLTDIATRTNLIIRLSDDYFHEMEISKKGLKDIRDRNIKILNQNFFMEQNTIGKIYVVDRIGRAKNLTDEDLLEINSQSENTKYIFGNTRVLQEYRKKYPLPRLIEDNVVDGSLNIDVFGNITPTYYPYEAEDLNSYSNIKNKKTLKMAIESIKI